MQLLRRLATRQLERNHRNASGGQRITQTVSKGTCRVRLGRQHHARGAALGEQRTQRINGDAVTHQPASRESLSINKRTDGSRRSPQEFDCLVGE